MSLPKAVFLRALSQAKIKSSIIEQINSKPNSPLRVLYEPLEDTLKQSNNLGHSYRVFQHSIQILSNLKADFSKEDYLLLFYSSLLHDISKVESEQISNDIQMLKIDKCRLTRDHGVLSAHYIGKKIDSQKLYFYGLKNDYIRTILNIVSFHEAGSIHSCFSPEDELKRKELLLCLVFRVADIADGDFKRARDTEFVEREAQTSKGIARLQVKEVRIKPNAIVWRVKVKKNNPALRTSLKMCSDQLSGHRFLLQVFGLPHEIVCLSKKERFTNKKEDISIKRDDIMGASLSIDVSKREIPLVLSAKTVKELYEQIVKAFCKISIVGKDIESYKNYFGPIVLEVKNSSRDELSKLKIRSETGKNVELIRDYSRKWLKDKAGYEKFFYFGYTHGQRIRKYLYPKIQREVNASFRDWSGKFNQFNNIAKIMRKQGFDARQSYAVIAHPIIDNRKIGFPRKDIFDPMGPPSLTFVQFRIEKGSKLSGFAFLRAQELSTFFIVNYLEVKSLMEELRKKLENKFRNLKLGRVVMVSTLGYFAPNTTLFDKPRISQKDEYEIASYVQSLDKPQTREEFINLLEEFGNKDYYRIDVTWCDHVRLALKGLSYSKLKDEVLSLKKMLRNLDDLKIEKKYPITHPRIKQGKKKSIDRFIRAIRREFNEKY